MKFFDVHTHVQFAAFQNDGKEVILRALENGVNLINVGTQKDTSEDAIKLAHEYGEGVFATAGLHPIHTDKSFHDAQELGGGKVAKEFVSRGEEFNYDSYKKLALDPKVVAIGECGLDYYRFGKSAFAKASADKQKEAFIKQIELASEIKKPLMIHCREAFPDLISILKSVKLNSPPGVIHFFSGTIEDADELMSLGFSFSFGGVITFARQYEKLVKHLPLEKILLETDAPYVAPVPYRGKRNEPSYVVEVAKKIAKTKNISLEEVAEITTKNAAGVFLEKAPGK